MAVTIALSSIVILMVIVGCLIFIKPQNAWVRFLLALYSYNLVSEIIMLIISRMGIQNHIVANVHVLLFGVGMLIVLGSIWKRLLKNPFPKWMMLVISISFFVIWLVDGLIIHSFSTFNPFTQAFIFTVNLFIVIYLLNVMIFSMRSRLDSRVDMFLIFAFLMHCFGAIIIDSFFNYYITLPDDVYLVTSYLGLVIGVVTNFLVLLAVRCLILNKKRFSR